MAQLALPSVSAQEPARRDPRKARSSESDAGGPGRTRRRSAMRRREGSERKEALQLDLTLVQQPLQDAGNEPSPVESARRAAMERSRAALRARLRLVSTREDTAGSNSRVNDGATPHPDAAMGDEVTSDSLVDDGQMPSEVLFVGRLPSKSTGEVASLLAERLSIPPPKTTLPFARAAADSVLEHRTAGAWLRVSRVSSGLHVLLAGDARHRWLSDIRDAVRELGLLEAE